MLLLTFVSVHLAAVSNERHLLRPAHVLVSHCGGTNIHLKN